MNKPAVVLVVDDDKNTREGLARALRPEYEVLLAEGADRALELLGERPVDVMLSDVRMPGLDGLALLQRALARDPQPVCIMLSAYGNVETAVEAMKRGAYDFLMKPVNLDHLDMLVRRALRARVVESENADLRRQIESRFGLENLIGTSPAMVEVFDLIRQIAPARATVLIQGESGTGKELVAHALHNLSPRSKGPFVAVHCAALSPTLLESELFGHEKGAFTGAHEQRRGRFELADGGTLFLDEISEVDPAIQVKLLRVLEERKFERVGGRETLEVDIRLVAATNRNLRAMVEEGRFRSDLFFRLDVVNVTLPPLRERVEDLPLLCDHFLREFNVRNGKQVEAITPEAMALLSAHPWPGNVRELRNVVERMVVLARGNRLGVRDIPPGIRGSAPTESAHGGLARPRATGTMEELERSAIVTALRRNDGNRTKAAEQLGISRRTMQRKLKRYRLEDEAAPETPAAGTPPAAKA
jgi:DNA-binding NtrC family response regulator